MSDRERPKAEEYVRAVRQQTTEYLRELLEQNRKLQVLNSALDSTGERLRTEKERLQEEVAGIRGELERERAERAGLERRLSTTVEESHELSSRFVEVEEQNNNLMHLYVASQRLHSTLDRAEVLIALKEIIINFVGSEEFAIFERIGEDDRFQVAAAHGVGPEQLPAMVGLEELELAAGAEAPSAAGGSPGLIACVPLRLGDRVTGVIAIVGLLGHKQGLVPLDHQLFDLLASDAAMALYASRLAANECRDGAPS